jgi:hypothetical protein
VCSNCDSNFFSVFSSVKCVFCFSTSNCFLSFSLLFSIWVFLLTDVLLDLKSTGPCFLLNFFFLDCFKLRVLQYLWRWLFPIGTLHYLSALGGDGLWINHCNDKHLARFLIPFLKTEIAILCSFYFNILLMVKTFTCKTASASAKQTTF